jgi:LemA protein
MRLPAALRFRLGLRHKIVLVLGTVAVLAVSVSGMRRLSPTYDTLVSLDEGVAKEWAGVEAQLQRRYDLIPNLVEVAKASAAHEGAVFVQIAEARAGYTSARSREERIEAAQRAEIVLRRLPVVVHESYPTLAANSRFRDLMRTLERTEDAILAQRLKYNKAVADYNGRQRSIEGRAVSAFTRFRPAAYYHAPPASQEPVALGTTASGALETKPAPSAVSSAEPAPPPHATNLVAFGDAVPTSDAGAATSATSAAPVSPAARFKLNGVMSAGSTREAVVVGPDGRSLVVSKGTVLPSTHARVVAIDDRGVTLEDRGPDGKGTPIEVRLQ